MLKLLEICKKIIKILIEKKKNKKSSTLCYQINLHMAFKEAVQSLICDSMM